MKIMITSKEALQKGVQQEIFQLFGLTEDDEVWDNEVFILTEKQAKELGLI
jgi:hypothetical protein